MSSILESDKWSQVKKLDEGWSRDEKYHVSDYLGNEYLLRLSNNDLFNKKKWQYEMLKKIDQLSINTPKPMEFGIYKDKVYILLSYIKGEKAETKITSFTIDEQYYMGYKAGIMLKKLHSIDIGEVKDKWYDLYQIKIKRKLKKLNEINIKLPKMDIARNYIIKNMEILKNRPSLFQHGDYHLGNMLIQHNDIFIIDFDKSGIADPIDEFKPFCWNVYRSVNFETGLINGYFNNQIPQDFFPLLSLYAAESLISHLPWAMTFGEKEVETAIKVFNDTLKWFNDFNSLIPTWFQSNKKC